MSRVPKSVKATKTPNHSDQSHGIQPLQPMITASFDHHLPPHQIHPQISAFIPPPANTPSQASCKWRPSHNINSKSTPRMHHNHTSPRPHPSTQPPTLNTHNKSTGHHSLRHMMASLCHCSIIAIIFRSR